MWQTEITRLLKIQYPVIQGGMAWCTDAGLVAAVSAGGGLGVLGAGGAPAEWVRTQIREVKAKTNKPFGVNIMLMSPTAPEVAEVVVEEGVPAVITGAGNPQPYMKAWKQAGITVVPVVASVALAVRMQRAGADAVVCEGCESGGHIGQLTTMTLIPQVCDAVDIPVIGAGGIADGRGMAAAFLLGASGIQVGTRFLCAEECPVADSYKQKVIKAKDSSTVVTGRFTGHPVRVLKNKMARQMAQKEKEGISPEEFEALGSGSLRAAAQGDDEWGSLMSGQIAGLVKKIEPAATIIRDLCEGCEQALQKAPQLKGESL